MSIAGLSTKVLSRDFTASIVVFLVAMPLCMGIAIASGIARGEIALHGWYVDIHAGNILGLDGVSGQFRPLREDEPLPVALPHQQRTASDLYFAQAAE